MRFSAVTAVFAVFLGLSSASEWLSSLERRDEVPAGATDSAISAFYGKCCSWITTVPLPAPFRWGIWVRGGLALVDAPTTQTHAPASNETTSPRREQRRALLESNALAMIQV